MKEIVSTPELVAYCGLYCGACRAYLRERCPGCHDNEKASWCKIRTCCMGQGMESCAECAEFPDPNGCRKFNNFISKIFALVFRSNRAACIRQIREMGIQGHAADMSENRRHTIKR
ncbi:MAG: DUF3795 domain-containing protein [Acidobacteria bacterium]|nr:DUF3795 domain-containing protein [Acidobacteriota bacterium]